MFQWTILRESFGFIIIIYILVVANQKRLKTTVLEGSITPFEVFIVISFREKILYNFNLCVKGNR